MTDVPVGERLALQELTNRYAFYCDTKRVDDVVALFTDDGIFDETVLGMMAVKGKPDLEKYFRAGGEFVDSMIHYVTNHLIEEFSDTEATGLCFILTEARLKDGSPIRVYGYFSDRYTKASGRWQFRSRNLVSLVPPELGSLPLQY